MSECCSAYFVSLTSAVNRLADERLHMHEEVTNVHERTHRG